MEWRIDTARSGSEPCSDRGNSGVGAGPRPARRGVWYDGVQWFNRSIAVRSGNGPYSERGNLDAGLDLPVRPCTCPRHNRDRQTQTGPRSGRRGEWDTDVR